MDNLEKEIQGENVPEIEPVEDAPKSDNSDMLSKNVVSKIIERERRKASEKAYEKGKREALMEINNESNPEAQAPGDQQPPQQSQNLGGMQQLTQADIERLIAEKAPQLLEGKLQEKAQEFQRKQMVDSFVNKISAASEKYPDLEGQLNELDYSSLSPVIEMATSLDNTAEIMKELLDHPEKMGNLIGLSHAQPSLARKRMADLSNSIKVNEKAQADEREAKEPMSQLKPSSNAGANGSDMSVTDMRKIFR